MPKARETVEKAGMCQDTCGVIALALEELVDGGHFDQMTGRQAAVKIALSIRRAAGLTEPLPSGESRTAKVAYVKAAGQTRLHECHWPGCTQQVPPAKWGCAGHWFKLPKRLRDRVWAAYVPGQEVDGVPSDEYLAVAREVQEWIKGHAE